MLLVLLFHSEGLSADTRGFKLFDATLYSNKPNLAEYGILSIKVFYAAELWRKGQDQSNLPDPIRIKEAVRRAGPGVAMGVIDIEHWPTVESDGRANTENLAKLRRVLAEFRIWAPGLTLGYYGLPKPDYWRAISSRGDAGISQWRAENDRAQSIVESQDAVFPSLYTFYADREGWVKYAVAQIAEARRIAKGKPVYVFLWPQYHESNPIIGLDYLKPDYWQLELDTVRRYADGAILWGGYQQEWDDRAEWWTLTKNFIKTLE